MPHYRKKTADSAKTATIVLACLIAGGIIGQMTTTITSELQRDVDEATSFWHVAANYLDCAFDCDAFVCSKNEDNDLECRPNFECYLLECPIQVAIFTWALANYPGAVLGGALGGFLGLLVNGLLDEEFWGHMLRGAVLHGAADKISQFSR